MGGKGRDSSLKEETSHTYTFRLGYSRNSILYKKRKKKKRKNKKSIKKKDL